MKHDDMREYRLRHGWVVRFPDEWMHDSISHGFGSCEEVFYPADSDLTVRISVLRVSRFGLNAPLSVLKRAAQHAIPGSAQVDSPSKIKIAGVTTITYDNIVFENGSRLTEQGVICMVPGVMLVAHIFCESAQECDDVLRYLASLKFCGLS